MSGPKCGEWSVQANLERERRVAEELRARIDKVLADIEALRVNWQTATNKFGSEFPSIPALESTRYDENADNDILNSSLQKLRNKYHAWEEQLAEAESVHRIRNLLAMSALQEETKKADQPDTQKVSLTDIEARKAKLSDMFSSLVPMMPSSDRELIEKLGRDALTNVDRAKFDSVLLEIRFHIQKHNQKRLEQSEKNAKIEVLLDRLTGLEGPEVLRLSQELLRARGSSARLPPNIEADVATTAAEAAADDDRRYASKVLIEELDKLGYATTSGMETVLASGGQLEVSKAELKEYAVYFAVDRDTGKFDVQLTRDADTTRAISNERRLRDHSMEEKWCGDLASLLSSAAERGVKARISKREKPGAIPVLIRRGSESRRRASASITRSMRLPEDE